MQRHGRWIGWTMAMAALVTLAAIPALAQGPRGGGRGKGNCDQRGGGRQCVVEKMQLSEEQLDKIGDLRGEWEKHQLLHRGEMASLRTRLEAEMMGAEVDEGKVKDLGADIAELQAKMTEARLEHRLAMLDVLTPEQREQWQDFKQWSKERGKARMGRGMQQRRDDRPGRGGPGNRIGRPGRGGRGFGAGPQGDGPAFGGGHGRGYGCGHCHGPRAQQFGMMGADPGDGLGPGWLDDFSAEGGEYPPEAEVDTDEAR